MKKQTFKKHYSKMLANLKSSTKREMAEFKVELRFIINEIPDSKYAPVKMYIKQKDETLFKFIEGIKYMHVK